MRTELSTPEAWSGDLHDYLGWLHAARRSPNTIKLQSYHLRRFAIDCRVPPREVGLQTLLDHLADRSWGVNTSRSVASTLRSFYDWQHLTGRMEHHAAELLPIGSAEAGYPRPASEVAIQFGLAGSDPRVRLMIRLGAQLGLRCCEIAVVATTDVRRDSEGYVLLVHGKGRKVRPLPMPDDLAHSVLELSAGYLFPGQIDGHLSAAYVSKLISRELPDGVTAHQLRHRFAAMAYWGSGKDIIAVMLLLGHASVATTQIYTPAGPDSLRRAVLAAA